MDNKKESKLDKAMDKATVKTLGGVTMDEFKKVQSERDKLKNLVDETINKLYEERRKARKYADQLNDPQLIGKAHGCMYAIELLTKDVED